VKKNIKFSIIIGIISSLIIVMLVLSGCWYNHKEPAEKNAKEYAQQILPGYKAVQCVNVDTDFDDYVSCTVVDKNDRLIPLECVGAVPPWYLVKNTGCRIPRFRDMSNGDFN